MNNATASIRELRTDFRTVKRKVEQYGEITITDNREPAYLLKALVRKPTPPKSMPDYIARLRKRQPKPMSEEASRRFWEEERGDR